jgi:outer membrane protein OmpA-like peptidoglycan-associated protein
VPTNNVPPAPKTYSGSYPDRLEAASRDALAGTCVRVVRDGDAVKLIIPVNAAFSPNSAQLRPRFSEVLDNLARLCREYDKTAIAVKGFTDSTGSFEHNQTLSEQRAQSIGAYLSRTVAAARIHTAGYGPRHPIADNRTDEGRMQNRRVEIEMAVTP